MSDEEIEDSASKSVFIRLEQWLELIEAGKVGMLTSSQNWSYIIGALEPFHGYTFGQYVLHEPQQAWSKYVQLKAVISAECPLLGSPSSQNNKIVFTDWVDRQLVNERFTFDYDPLTWDAFLNEH